MGLRPASSTYIFVYIYVYVYVYVVIGFKSFE
jgi:hypothetical protein